ncbi:hypothetical protein MCAG_01648 [Micromonospora sp. ATCC 39149]|uniref:Uncharacterized protein n=1 Tax=Micromonospora carbonacea TaxID=47853 RepID=A0A7D5YBL7_9ACTN|nr:hypothetical protein [Micromonospora sp. ATCC 39149]EEP71322.1 hypothetical protein MCAG_01648 [Micromonospora sp. ATCC 39149]QLJ97597.1 hypothetical protein HZU44_22865 [Micromonospora carbonacea]
MFHPSCNITAVLLQQAVFPLAHFSPSFFVRQFDLRLGGWEVLRKVLAVSQDVEYPHGCEGRQKWRLQQPAVSLAAKCVAGAALFFGEGEEP